MLADSAEWIWNIADRHFVGATQIVDIWHARQHIWELAGKLFPSDDKRRKQWSKKLLAKLNAGRIEFVVDQIR